MATVSGVSAQEQPTREQRQAALADHHDEVWDGEYFMSPVPNDEHQHLVAMLTTAFVETVMAPGLGLVRPGVNLSDRVEGWLHNYRGPDVVVILNDTKAVNCDTHWVGAIDFLVEIVSPDDRSRKKLPFYGSLGVREVLIVDRYPWVLELYRNAGGELRLVGSSTADEPTVLKSAVIPLTFRLAAAEPRPQVVVAKTRGKRTWRF
jgi:Uma2 family endonuclease